MIQLYPLECLGHWKIISTQLLTVNSLCLWSHQEDFLDLTACVCGMGSLENALWAMFVEEEMFEGNNLYRCAKCDGLVTAAKVSLDAMPPSHISHC